MAKKQISVIERRLQGPSALYTPSEKIPLVEPTLHSVATAKNSSAVTNSGRRPVAHRLMHRKVIPPAWATCGASPTSGPAAHIAPAPHSSTVGSTAGAIRNGLWTSACV